MRSFSTACAHLHARDESLKRSFRRLRRFLLHSFAQLDVTTWPFTPLFLSLFFRLFSLKKNGALVEISQILGSDIFFCVESLGIYRPRTRTDDTRECNKDKYLLERERSRW